MYFKTKKTILPVLLLSSFYMFGQYTEVINSNRPGKSMSAFAVGTKVIQGETGFSYSKQKHNGLKTTTTSIGFDFALRYGLLKEQLELVWQGQYLANKKHYDIYNTSNKKSGLESHSIGAKYLIFDPYKNEEKNKPNLYSWKANHSFKWRDLLPAVAIYAGVNFDIGDNVFYTDQQNFSPKIAIATQNHFKNTWVFVTNIYYDKITTKDPVLGYILTLTHALRNPKWSIFIENEGIKSDNHADALLKTGAAYLFSKNFQIDARLGMSTKNTPSNFFGGIGVSYRLDYHKDALIKPDNGSTLKTQLKQKKFKKKQQKKKAIIE